MPCFSTRTSDLKKDFLQPLLKDATQYFRFAGYFRSSIFEIVGEELLEIPDVRIICNSNLDEYDFEAARRSAAFIRAWNETNPCEDAVLNRERYRLLDAALRTGNAEIRVLPQDKMFLHGKAGVVRKGGGSMTAFIGSVNETASAFSPKQYEIVMQDDRIETVRWLEREFDALWNEAVPLPEAFPDLIHRLAERTELPIDAVPTGDLPGAVFSESPIYRAGERLQVWQRLFIIEAMRRREIYGKARMLLADEVGIGKTLSLAGFALLSALLKDGPVLVLVPAALTLQWQTELQDKLGVPAAVWSAREKAWFDIDGIPLSPRNEPENVARCPWMIGIVSAGLITQQRRDGEFTGEAAALLSRGYGTVILDEAHRARSVKKAPNNLLAFMLQIARQSRHVLLGTATPVQTDMQDLWDLLGILDSGAPFVLGSPNSPWRSAGAADVASGKRVIATEEEAWRWLDPVPARGELPPGSVQDRLRDLLQASDTDYSFTGDYEALDLLARGMLGECREAGFFRQCNPVIRHVVLRKRKDLEEAGLLSGIDVRVHPLPDQPSSGYGRFDGLGLRTDDAFNEAYGHAEHFCRLLRSRSPAAGFMKTILLQRLCSSAAAGLRTARAMLAHSLDDDSRGEHDGDGHVLDGMTEAEAACLRDVIDALSRMQTADPKLETVQWFLENCRTDGRTWLEHGAIVFSQYFDTASWIADELALRMPAESIALYAGAGRSRLHRNGMRIPIDREILKRMIGRREARLVVATDAACEGLNLQALGTLVNVDLPWNPGRLEQRLGRIRRCGQGRKAVDMLNLVYGGTQDERIYSVLSRRMKDIYDLFGVLPDSLEDDWISDEERLRREIELNASRRKDLDLQDVFSLKYRIDGEAAADDWSRCSAVVARRDVLVRLREPWPA